MLDLSDTPAGMIARLDDALARRGQNIVLRKANATDGQVAVRAKVRFYKPNEIVGIIQQGDSNIVISPSGIGAFGIPPQNGFAVVEGAPRRIVSVNPIYIGGILVRVEMQVRG